MDRSALARKPMTELKDIAAHLEMRGYQKLRKADLIDAIVESGTGGNGAAPASQGEETAEEGARKVLPPSARRYEPSQDSDDPVGSAKDSEAPAKDTGNGSRPAGSDAPQAPQRSNSGPAEDTPEADPPAQADDNANASNDDNDTASHDASDNDDATDTATDGDGDGGNRKRRNRRDRRKRGRDREGTNTNTNTNTDSGRSSGGADANDPGEVRAGVLDILPEGYGFLRTTGYLPGERDVYVSQGQIRKHALRRGDVVQGPMRPQRSNEKVPALHHVQKVNGEELEDGQVAPRDPFDDLPVRPADSRIDLSGGGSVTARLIDLTAPVAQGQRTLVVTPPRADGAAFLREVARAIAAVRPDSHLMSVCIDATAEDLAAAADDNNGELISSTFDQPAEEHIGVAELALERARRLVELGHDVVVLLDSLTRLARAYGVNAGTSHRMIAPNVDAASLYPPKRFMASARNIRDGGSLTVIATVLTDSGSAHDQVIAAEFRRVANAEIVLDEELARLQVSPPLSLSRSYSRTAAALHDDDTLAALQALRSSARQQSPGKALDQVITLLDKTQSNAQLVDQILKANPPGTD